MDRKIIIGIDPGVNGGIAYYMPINREVYAISMPDKIEDFDKCFSHVLSNSIVYIEDVPPFVGVNRPAARIFKLAKNYGIILGVLTALEIEYKLVRPMVWMKAIGAGKRKDFENDNKWKNHLKKLATDYFPNSRPTLKTADALLILEYGLQQYFSKDCKDV